MDLLQSQLVHFIRPRKLLFSGQFVFLTTFCLGLVETHRISANSSSAVNFDVPAIVIAEAVNPAVVGSPTMGGELIRLKIPVSFVVDPKCQSAVRELMVELSSPNQTARVVDFSPKNETYSEYEGTIHVDTSRQKEEHFAFSLGAAYPGVGQANANGEYRNKLNVEENFQRRPPAQNLTSSGTIQQGFGAFFKFRPGPVDELEGSRDIAILVEVPRGWRAGLLLARMTASGDEASQSYGNHKRRFVASGQFWISTHREGDGVAAAQALAFVRQERHLRGLATTERKEVEKRAMPSVWHKVGAAMDIVDSRIPTNYLDAAIFGPERPQFDNGTQRLPVDLRIAILDFWEKRSVLVNLGLPKSSATNLAVAAVK